MDVLSRARKYLDRCPPAVSGQGGHDATYRAAVALVHGFCLDFANAMSLMTEWNARCQPPWSDQDLHHKVRDALEKSHDKPRGFLLGDGDRRSAPAPFKAGRSLTVLGALANSLGSKGVHKVKEDIKLSYEMPVPLENGACELLRSAFIEGEGVRIVPARLNDDGKEIPDGLGPCLSREEWLKRLESKAGNPNGIWKSDDRTGIYIGLNPLKIGGAKDEDVTAYRHVLVEFDKSLSIEEQWNLYMQTALPCSAIIFSGGQSLHAWVRVDARDSREFSERVKVLWDYFEPYGLDPKNKNPSRLSRLPNCVRFDKRQELWALKTGAPSFVEWLADKEVAGLGQQVDVGALLAFDTADDPNVLLGTNRWLCRGAACAWIGQSGIGKSALAVQAAMLWACGRTFFGVPPIRALKSLIVQHENDEGDMSEMVKGVAEGLALTDSEMALVRKNLVIVRNRTHAGGAFVQAFGRLVAKHAPDLAWVDPLYAYIGGDMSKAEVLTEFLVTGLGPILEASGVCVHFMHHPGKPPSDSKARRGWSATDWSYAGLGSSALTNWVRAALILIGSKQDGVYQLLFGKRGSRAGARDISGGATKRLWLAHSQQGICWVQVAEPEREEPRNGRPVIEFDPEKFLQAVKGEHFTYADLIQQIEARAGCKNRKAKEIFAAQLKGRVDYDGASRTYSFGGAKLL